MQSSATVTCEFTEASQVLSEASRAALSSPVGVNVSAPFTHSQSEVKKQLANLTV